MVANSKDQLGSKFRNAIEHEMLRPIARCKLISTSICLKNEENPKI